MSLPLLGAGMATDGPSAVLDLNFASLLSLTPSVGPTPSYTRASTGTYFNSSGVLTTAAINGPRFDHVYNGSSWESKGLLIEEARTNAVLYSADFTSGWTSSNVGMSTGAGTAPDGTSTAVKLYPTVSTTQTRIYLSGGANTCISVFAKAAEKTTVYFYDLTGISECYFNLSTGAIGTNSTGLTAAISNCGGGWFRCSLSSASIFSYFQIGVCEANGSTSSTASGTNGILIWGAQWEIGAFPTSYIPTTTAAVTRSADVCQITGGDFSGFWNASEGSIAFDGDYLGPDSTVIRYTFGVSNTSSPSNSFIGSATNRMTSGNYSTIMYNNGSLEFQLDTGTNPSSGSRIALGLAFKQNDFAISRDGGSPVIDSTGSIPTINAMAIGSLYAFNGYMNGHIARLRYYNTRLINSQLVALST